MSEPYYQDDRVTLYHGSAFDLFPSLADRCVDAVITDPPYAERTHVNARAHRGKVVTEGISFAAITDAALASALRSMGRVSRGWVIATLDYRHAVQFDTEPPEGLKCQRVGVWVKTNPTPQLTGDRPAQGWESIAYFHRADRRSNWNGGGLHGNYTMRIAAPEGHPTAKPLPLVQDLVRKFTNHGDIVLDPFAGSGTTLRAAVNEGRRAIGIEIDEHYCELIAKRMGQMALDFREGA